MRLLLSLVVFPSCVLPACATTCYVSGQGLNSATGQSLQAPSRTLQHAADLTQPGDTVLILNGTYSLADSVSGDDVLRISRPGTPGNWIMYKANGYALPGERQAIAQLWDRELISDDEELLQTLLIKSYSEGAKAFAL